ncbi:MAG: ABC transporter permease [Planctomycetes bacterium]|nr:ABC transporter permease [Planctomycetota bacterium]NUQ33660.1 ABC transporter permease [Planctomycetaceae bacterium]
MISVLRRELLAFFTSAAGYVLMAVFPVAMGLLALFVFPAVLERGASWFHTKELTMRSFFLAFPWVAAAVMPAIAMRSWAEEYRGNTFQLLLTLPAPSWRLVAGKYLASVAVLCLMLLTTGVFPVMIAANGGWEGGPIFGGYLGCLLLGSGYLAIGMFASSLTSNQLGAYMAALLACGTLTALGSFAGLAGSSGALSSMVRFMAAGDHFNLLAAGYLKLETVTFFISMAAFFLMLTALGVEGRRYR